MPIFGRWFTSFGWGCTYRKWWSGRSDGFRPARSAGDGAAVTQLPLELGRLKGWQVSGVGPDYRECFNLMPQGIVFEVCGQLAICPGVQWVMEAMYGQLVRAFRLAGGPGS